MSGLQHESLAAALDIADQALEQGQLAAAKHWLEPALRQAGELEQLDAALRAAARALGEGDVQRARDWLASALELVAADAVAQGLEAPAPLRLSRVGSQPARALFLIGGRR